MKSNQTRFLFAQKNDERSYGGSNIKRIRQRPVTPKKSHHVSLRASQARGAWSFLSPKNSARVDKILNHQAKRHFVVLESYVNVGNHLHLKVRPQTRTGFANFLRSVSCLIARAITKARKGHPLKQRFFDALAWTRVLLSWKEEKTLDRYFSDNALEAAFGPQVRAVNALIRQGKFQI